MKIKYKRIDIRTLKGLKEAERLQEKGWVLYSNSIDVLYFYKMEGII